MPTNYPGNPAAGAEGASPAPDPDNFPIVTMPLAGEAVVVAGVQQAWKTIADHLAFLKAPRAIASAWTQAVRSYRNAKLHRVWGVDHFGHPSGELVTFEEDWIDVNAADKTVLGSGAWFGPWNYGLFGTTPGTVKADGAGSNLSAVPWGGIGQVFLNSSIPAAALIEMCKPWLKISGASFEMSIRFSVNGAFPPDAQTTFAIGFSDGSLVGGGSTVQFAGIAPTGAGIYLAGGANWTAYAKAPSAGVVAVGTGVALARDTPHHYKLVCLGTTGSDDSTARVLHFIDGALVANQTVDMTGAFVFPFIRMSNSVNAEVCALNCGPLRLSARLALGDAEI